MTPQREAAVTMIAATLARGAQDGQVQKLFAMIGDESAPAWQRAALMRGAEIAVLGAAMPGTPARRGGARGGAECALPDLSGRARRPRRRLRVPAGAAASGRRPPALQLTPSRRPSRRWQQRAANWGRAEKLLARIEWPGKPGAAAPLAPLTPEEQKRFDAGREIYRNVCQACHQADGRGLEKLAPAARGSAYALGRRPCRCGSCCTAKKGRQG